MLELDENAAGKSRLVALRISIMLLRLTESWRRPLIDHDSAIILLAITAICGEKLTRTRLEPEFHDLAVAIPRDRLTACNISSIAEATGINRETARRKVDRLVKAGVLSKENGLVYLSPGFSQRSEPRAILSSQLEVLRQTANALIRDGVFMETAD